ncbi:hypothetical protein, partial [Flavobacterium zepuense]|uniref:hypothetical protein n=1 Tax=Flavobacterium zepuense TaxID=2593302 RepID=UPI001C8F56C2
SIWGTRASNGVIVLTSKKGKKNQPLSISFSSTLTVGSKPNLYYRPQISSSDFIDIEQDLFKNNYYFFDQLYNYTPLSPAVEIFIQRSNNQITAADSASRIDALKAYDVRSQLNRYAYRPSVPTVPAKSKRRK